MSIIEEVAAQMKEAMKARQTERLSALRLIKSDLAKAELDSKKEMDEAMEIAALNRMANQRKDSIEQFEAAGRTELAEKEKSELAIIETFLPAGLDPAEMEKIIDEVLSKADTSDPKNFGKVMGQVMKALKATGGSFDGKAVNALVRGKIEAG